MNPMPRIGESFARPAALGPLSRRPVRRFASACAAILLAGTATAGAAEFRLVSVNGEPLPDEAMIAFSDDGSITGTSGCNRFRTTGAMRDGTLAIDGPVTTTMMACADEARIAGESAILSLLEGDIAVTFDPFAGDVTLSNEAVTLVGTLATTGDASSVADRVPPTHAGRDAPAGDPPYLNPFGLSGDMPIRARPDAEADIVARAYSGMVLRNEGCEGGWCAVETPDGSARGWADRSVLEPSGGALRAGQGLFDAAGIMPCAQGEGAPMTQCAFGVAREGGGTATVVVTKPDGVERALFFVDGTFLSADSSQAGGGFETSATRQADLQFISVDSERYEVPDAVIFGG